VPAAERRQRVLVEPGSGLRRRVGLQEGQGDLGGEPEEDPLGAGPVGVQQRAELVAGRGLGLEVVVAQPDQGLQLAGAGVHRLEPAQPVAVGARVLGQLVAVAGVGLGAGGAPAGPGGVERSRVDRDHGVAGGDEPVDDQAVAALDGDRQVGRVAVLGQPREGGVEVVLGVVDRPAVDDRAGGVEDGYGMAGAGPVPPDEQQGCLRSRVVLVDARWRGRRRCLIVRPSLGHTPDAGRRPRRVPGRQD
jgi:hypothetical protein